MSKTYETWQVMRLLSRRRDWRAEAPETRDKLACRALPRSEVPGVNFQFLVTSHPSQLPQWQTCVYAPERQDWRIIKPKKRTREVVTRISGAREVEFRDGFISRWRKLDPSKTYKLVEVGE